MSSCSRCLRSFAALLACTLTLQSVALVRAAHADMISTDSFLAGERSSSDRGRILTLLERKDVQKRLQAYGITAEEASLRIKTLSDAELSELGRKLDEMPAGKDGAGEILGVALTVFVILLITDILCLTKVFKFTRCAN